MKTKTPKKVKTDKKPKCEAGTHLACTGMMVRKMTGPKKDDPKFFICFGCETYLRRQGLKLKEV